MDNNVMVCTWTKICNMQPSWHFQLKEIANYRLLSKAYPGNKTRLEYVGYKETQYAGLPERLHPCQLKEIVKYWYGLLKCKLSRSDMICMIAA